MILSSLRIEWISDQKGYGLFATKKIFQGTVTFVQDSLDLVIKARDVTSSPAHIKKIIERYSYQNASNDRVLSWDLGKYMNHCCYANTLTTGYGFEIAIRDIEVGDEVTDDYRIFTVDHPMVLQCDNKTCGGYLDREDYWDIQVKAALQNFKNVDQELSTYLDEQTIGALEGYLSGVEDYIKVDTQFPKVNFEE